MLEASRMQAEYDAAKRSCDQMAEVSKAVLDTWGRIESMQTQEIRFLLEQELGVISQKTCGFINQTIQKTLLDCGMSLEDMDVGNGTRDARSKCVTVPWLGPDTERVAQSCRLWVSGWKMEVPMTNYKNALLRKLE